MLLISEILVECSAKDFACRFLFQKRLSASDTGPLGRVVLPRAAAEAYLPRLPERKNGGGTQLAFVDARTGTSKTPFALAIPGGQLPQCEE